MAVSAAILLSSYFTETWALEAGEAVEREIGRAHETSPTAYRSLLARQIRLHAITRRLRVAAVLYLLGGVLADWLCVTFVR